MTPSPLIPVSEERGTLANLRRDVEAKELLFDLYDGQRDAYPMWSECHWAAHRMANVAFAKWAEAEQALARYEAEGGL